MSHLLVFLQLAVVEESLSTQVTHEWLGVAVKKHMSLQLVVLNETLPADLTLERLFARVNANVSLQVVLKGETCSTRLTREHFPPVDGLVRPERSPLYESFSTHRAFVRMFTGVNAAVALQRERIPETLPALGALVQLLHRVNDLMSLQVVFRFEALPAGGADERTRVRVHKLMSLQVHFCFELLLAQLALEGGVLPLLVSQQVVLESHHIPESSRALVAGERPLLFVSVRMLQQMKLPAEALVTDVAYEHLPFLPAGCFLSALAVGVFRLFCGCCGIILCSVYTEEMSVTTCTHAEEQQPAALCWCLCKITYLLSIKGQRKHGYILTAFILYSTSLFLCINVHHFRLTISNLTLSTGW